MKKNMAGLILVLFAIALFMTGCEKKAQEKEEAQEASARQLVIQKQTQTEIAEKKIEEKRRELPKQAQIEMEVTQRIPILRVMSANGENYYLDNKGTVMPPDAKCVAHLAVVTGNVEKSFAMRDLYKFGVFLQKNSFWNAQIEQIHVLPGKNIELVPRVGDHLIYLGKMAGFEKKLKRVKAFYERGLNQVGWNKYSRINVEFDNQIICTKRE